MDDPLRPGVGIPLYRYGQRIEPFGEPQFETVPEIPVGMDILTLFLQCPFFFLDLLQP